VATVIGKVREWLPFLVAAVGLVAVVGALAPTAWARLFHPYDLEWMEGGMLVHAWRIREGLPLYPPPGPDWVPYIYPPGYPGLLAALSPEIGYVPARILSWLGTLTAAAGVGLLVARYSTAAAVGTSAIFLSLWPDTGAFYDLARPDALALGLLSMAAVGALSRSPAAQVAGGLLLCAAFLVKHHAAAFGPALVAGLWLRDRTPAAALRFGLSAMVPAVIATGVLHVTTEGGFLRYLLQVPASHGHKWPRAWPGTPWEVGSALPVVVLGAAVVGAIRLAPARLPGAWFGGLAALGLLAAVLTLPDKSSVVYAPLDAALHELAASLPGWHAPSGVAAVGAVAPALGVVGLVIGVPALFAGSWRDRALPILLFCGAVALGVGAVMRAHVGGFVNVQMPLYAFVCVAGGLAGASLLRAGGVGTWIAGALFVGQLLWAWTRWDAPALTPTPADRQAGDRVVEVLQKMPGPIFSPYAPWLAVQAGHRPGPHLIAIWDFSRHPSGPWPESGKLFRRAAAAHHWQTVVRSADKLGYGIEDHYRLEQALPVRGGALRPRTGWRARPESVWIPIDEGGAPPEAR
jgi:hypothetical protein